MGASNSSRASGVHDVWVTACVAGVAGGAAAAADTPDLVTSTMISTIAQNEFGRHRPSNRRTGFLVMGYTVLRVPHKSSAKFDRFINGRKHCAKDVSGRLCILPLQIRCRWAASIHRSAPEVRSFFLLGEAIEQAGASGSDQVCLAATARGVCGVPRCGIVTAALAIVVTNIGGSFTIARPVIAVGRSHREPAVH